MSDRTQVSYHKPKELGYGENRLVLKAGSQITYSEAEASEYVKCLNDVVYFARNYCKVIHVDRGLVDFELYKYQEEFFALINANNRCICLTPRQAGKTTMVAIWLLWYALFHADKMIGIVANKSAAAREVLSRITLCLENLPFFLQTGCKELNKGSITWANNSCIFTSATTGSSCRGKSLAVLYIDEMSFIENDVEFFESTYPTVASGRETKVIITSTPKGQGNLFHKMWEGALQGISDFKPLRVHWYDVPGRDEEFKRKTIASTSQRQWDQEMEGNFLGSSTTLVTSEALILLRAQEPIKVEFSGALKIFKDPVPGHFYVMNGDVGKGRGKDYSTLSLIDVSVSPFEQVAVYRNNTISPILFPNVISKIGKRFNEAYAVIESNDSGEVVIKGLRDDLEYENVYIESSKSMGAGLRMTSKTKRIGCSNLKDLLEGGQLVIYDAGTISELSNFVASGDSFAASAKNHDDLVMTLVGFGAFIQSDTFVSMTDINLRELLFQEKIREMEDDIIPVGIFNDGREIRDMSASRVHNDPLDRSF